MPSWANAILPIEISFVPKLMQSPADAQLARSSHAKSSIEYCPFATEASTSRHAALVLAAKHTKIKARSAGDKASRGTASLARGFSLADRPSPPRDRDQCRANHEAEDALARVRHGASVFLLMARTGFSRQAPEWSFLSWLMLRTVATRASGTGVDAGRAWCVRIASRASLEAGIAAGEARPLPSHLLREDARVTVCTGCELHTRGDNITTIEVK